MKISIVALLYNNDINNLAKSLDILKKQTIGDDNLEIIIVDKTKGKVDINIQKTFKENNIKIVNNIDFNIKELKGKYISFFDLNYVIKEDAYLELYKILETDNLDFISANIYQKPQPKLNNKNDILNSNFNSLTSLKLIKKELLLKTDFEFLKIVDKNTIKYLDFKLYILDLKFKIMTNVKYKNIFEFDEEYMLQEIDIINYIVDMLIQEYGVNFEEKIKFIILNHAMYIIDKNIFLNNICEEKQMELYANVSKLLNIVDKKKLASYGLEGYKPVLRLISKGLYEETTQYISLLRSKRYWYNRSKKYEKYINKNSQDLTESLSWKVTKPLRLSRNNLIYLNDIIAKYFILILGYIVKFTALNKDIWLVGERADQAEDNGYFFFKYCRENYSKEKIYYVIDKNSPHLDKIDKFGNIIYRSSLKHKIYMVAADVYINAWTFEECSYPEPKEKFIKQFKNVVEKKYNISLQHGVIIHNIAPYLQKDRYKLDYIIASSMDEKKIIKNTLGYSDDEVIVTGLARFDNLYNFNVNNQILIMPTWRRSLSNKNKSEFLKSNYYKTYKSLLQNEKLLNIIEKKNIKVKFYVHSQMQKFMDSFIIEHPNIEFLTKSNSIVSELLKESALLITDYSSVSTDFLYMNKPVLLYQFDPENNHHAPSKEIRYGDIGIIIREENELVDNIEEIINRKFRAYDKYIKNSKRIFKYKDNKNSERIFNEIKQRTAKKK